MRKKAVRDGVACKGRLIPTAEDEACPRKKTKTEQVFFASTGKRCSGLPRQEQREKVHVPQFEEDAIFGRLEDRC